MTANFRTVVLFGGILLAAVGCASHDEWVTWKGQPTHFASAEHMTFSVKNAGEGRNPVVSRTNIASARKDGWWGKAVTVSQDQILDR